MRKYKDVNCADKKENLVWNTNLIETMEFENLIGQTAQGLYSGEARHESRGAHAHEDFTERDDVQWTKHTLSRLDAKHVEDAQVVLEYREGDRSALGRSDAPRVTSETCVLSVAG